MPSASGIRAGKAYVEIGTNNSPLARGLKSAAGLIGGFTKIVAGVAVGLTALGAAGVAGAVAATKSFADFGSEIADASARSGASTDFLQTLKYAAQQTGSSFESVTTGIRKMQDTLAQAAAGNDTAVATLKKLGLTIEDLKGLSPEEQFAKLADAFAKITDPAQRTALAMDLFGKSGTELIPILDGGSEGLGTWRKRLEEVGGILSSNDIEAADAFGDALDDVGSAVRGVVNTVGAMFAPALTAVAETIRIGIAATRRWLESNKELVQSVLEFTGGIRDALADGQIGLAAEIAWAGVKVAFFAGADAVLKKVEDWAEGFQFTFQNAFYNVLETVNEVWASIRTAAAIAAAGFQNVWQDAINYISRKLLEFYEGTRNVIKATADWFGIELVDVADTTGVFDTLKGMIADQKRADPARDIQKIEEDRFQQAQKNAGIAFQDGGLRKIFGDPAQALADAREELDRLMDQARKGAGQLSPFKPKGIPGKDEADSIAREVAKFAGAGTFNAAAVRGLGAGRPEEQTAKNTEKIAKGTEEQLEKLDEIIRNTEEFQLVTTA